MFIVLILSLAVAKLWGYGWGVLTLITLVLSYQQHPVLPWVWMQVIAALALLRVLPGEGKLQWWAKSYRNLSLLVLLILVIPFLIDQVRIGLYPQLSQPWRNLAEEQYAYDTYGFDSQNQMAAPEPVAPMLYESEERTRSTEGIVAKSKKLDSSQSLALIQIDPNVYVQTGQGLPRWQWQKVDLTWSGPVSHEQMMQLWLLPPEWTRVLNIIRAMLVGILATFFLYLSWATSARAWFYAMKTEKPTSPSTNTGNSSTAALPLLLLFVGVISAGWSPSGRAESAMASYPSPELLSELRQRVLALPDCMPHCVSSPQVHLQLEGNVLTLRQQVHSAVDAAIPLPGQDRHWLAQQVWVNGELATALRRDDQGQLWLSLTSGIHELQLMGIVPSRNSWQLPFQLKPKRLTLSVEGWQVEGLRDSGEVEGTLQFTRQLSADPTMPLEMGMLPPFVEVERVLSLGLDWQVQTTVTRLSPSEGAVVLEIPLLSGESVTSEHGRVVQGHLQLTLPAQQKSLTWSSVLQPQPSLTLTAATSLAMTEVWRLNVSAIWHLALSGIPQVQQHSEGYWSPVWRPFPGEQVTLALSRPLGVAGQLLTMDNSVLEVTPGQRSTDYTLTLSIRSGRGTRHPIGLPVGAELQSVFIDHVLQPIQAQNDQVVLPIRPGAQQVVIRFREARGTEIRFSTAQVNLGVDSVNHRVEISPPSQRWILFTWGDAVGPAVLIWGVLLVMLLLSVGLGRLSLTPLKTRHWLLLTVVLTPLSVELVLLVVGWLLALGWRRELKTAPLTWRFNLLQLALALWTVVALWTLLLAIQQGLLGHPDMHIAGNGSNAGYLRWYQDRVDGVLPLVGFLSLSMWWYRVLMLLWALWLSFALLRWLPWAWECFTVQGLSRPFWERKGKTVMTESK
ncbi:hypothetical protein [Thioflexithrix psekupsensis]|uniref:Uncharacterized protein n=1 Tax=Thioflexithrix psekupsensis TaxID=1570016 RepID=A0A251X8R0_9GAMM|nr:hypothetical protein [Thioflexithrix psekupsensis]OUD14361.1 hypothetical protein TPSD3_08575 [Thioflexithrix psekupsensis]